MEPNPKRMIYSCVIVCAAPQAPEKTTNIPTDMQTISFLPKRSLALAQMIRNPMSIGVSRILQGLLDRYEPVYVSRYAITIHVLEPKA